jgi:alkylation response protein AidB-like acyl-CoA dehydrogenase
VGGIEGKGLKEANKVFGYTRLMVATFGLGGGMAALEKSIAYAKERIQFGTPLVEKQGYTHQLLVPNAVRLEAARAYIEETASRLDTEEEDLQVEGSIAKYFATEAGDAMANDAIQALGGYGYIREYEVEKIKRDIKITTIFEGTSEIQRNIISMFRLRSTVRTKGAYYNTMADGLEGLPRETGGHVAANAVRALNRTIMEARKQKLTRQQYIMFLLADMMTWCEVADALCRKAAAYDGDKPSQASVMAASRLFAREAAETVYMKGLRIARGTACDSSGFSEGLNLLDMAEIMSGTLEDMDVVASELVS